MLSAEQDRALEQLATKLSLLGYRFVTPTPRTHETVNARTHNAVARDLAGVFGWSRPFAKETLPPDIFDLAHASSILLQDGDLWRSRVRFSTLDELLFVHAAHPTREADAIFFGPDTYRFARALRHYLTRGHSIPCRVADIGCGTGAGAMLVARLCPNAEIVMSDISPNALRYARINADVAGLKRIQAVQSDLLDQTEGLFDLIIANPPYMADALKRTYRDGGGQFGEGLSIRIVMQAIERLSPGGTLLLYTGAAIVDGLNLFLDQVGPRLVDAGWHWSVDEIDPDVFGEELEPATMDTVDRIAVLWLVATRPLSAL